MTQNNKILVNFSIWNYSRVFHICFFNWTLVFFFSVDRNKKLFSFLNMNFYQLMSCCQKMRPAEQLSLSLLQRLCHSRILHKLQLLRCCPGRSLHLVRESQGIKVPLFSWSLVSMVLMSGAWVGFGSGIGGFKAPQDYGRSRLMMVPVLQGIGNWSILACISSTSCSMPIG